MFRPTSAAAIALLLVLVCLAAASAGAELRWRDHELACGTRLTLVDTGRRGTVGLALYFPAGTVHAADDPTPALMAPRLLLESLDGASFDARLRDWGWRIRYRTDLHGAGVFLAGPPERFEEVFDHLLKCLESPAGFDEADLDAAWKFTRERWARMAARKEAQLSGKAEMAFFGDHPYRAGLGQVPPASPAAPRASLVRQFMMQRYRAGGAFLLVAGDIDPDEAWSRWESHLNAIPGVPSTTVPIPAVIPEAGRLNMVNDSEQTLLIVKFPGPMGGSRDAAPTALLAGVLGQLLKREIVDAGIARSANVWYDFMSPGPRPLEIQVRNFRPDDAGKIEGIIEQSCRNMAEGDFSKFLVISAKDNLFEMLDSGTAKGDGPKRDGASAMIAWCQTVAWQNLHFQEWRAAFEEQLLGTGRERIGIEAKRRLEIASAHWSRLSPEVPRD